MQYVIVEKTVISYRFKVLLSLYKERTNYWLPIIHSLSFCAEEGHPLSLRYSKKEFESNDILIHFVEFSNVHNSDRISNVTQSNIAAETMGFHDPLLQ